MAASHTANSAIIGNYNESINAAGELVITGIYKGTQVSQTIPCNPPCILFIDPSSTNFVVLENIHDMSPNWEFVKLITSIS